MITNSRTLTKAFQLHPQDSPVIHAAEVSRRWRQQEVHLLDLHPTFVDAYSTGNLHW